MKFFRFLATAAVTGALATGSAHALPIIDGWTAVRLTSAPALVGAGLTLGGLGTAVVSPGSDEIPVAYFPITGGFIDTGTFAGSIEHDGSGLSLGNMMNTVKLENFVINTVALELSGDVTVGGTTLDDVVLFSIGLTGSPAYPFSLTLTSGAAGALSFYLGLPDLTGVEVGIASTTPVTGPVPEASTYLLMLAGLGTVGLFVRRRSRVPAPAMA